MMDRSVAKHTAVASLAALLALASLAAGAADAPAAGAELPNYMVPIKPNAAEAYWAPDSRHLIAQTNDPQAVPGARGGLGNLTWIFSDDGKEMWRVNDHGQDACSFFFPDGKRIVWTSTRDHMDLPKGDWTDPGNYPQGAELYISDWKGGHIQRLTNNKYYEAEVSVSPDGQWVTFGRQIDGNMDIWVIRPDGSGEQQVTRTADWQEGAPFFMPDSEHIIFRAWRTADQGKVRPTPMTVFTIKRDGSDWRRHTFDNGLNWHPTPAPDGHHYVFVRAETPTNWEIYLGDLAGGEPRRLTYHDKMDILAHISPDGRKMNWGRATGPTPMSDIRTFVMDVSSLGLGPERRVPWNPGWGQPMPSSAGEAAGPASGGPAR
ncbi:MAG: PD40 domain-containing protein [Gammaproteobacteria bacterium]|nr:PD40 domain-containing protein [Gammaproteobacteria bacterium]